jgi:hypothetical protein
MLEQFEELTNQQLVSMDSYMAFGLTIPTLPVPELNVILAHALAYSVQLKIMSAWSLICSQSIRQEMHVIQLLVMMLTKVVCEQELVKLVLALMTVIFASIVSVKLALTMTRGHVQIAVPTP